jgi:hypothetical protein
MLQRRRFVQDSLTLPTEKRSVKSGYWQDGYWQKKEMLHGFSMGEVKDFGRYLGIRSVLRVGWSIQLGTSVPCCLVFVTRFSDHGQR